MIGIGAPSLGPDGDYQKSPSNYPNLSFKKNSLIVKIGG
jgi:hypothetical protein